MDSEPTLPSAVAFADDGRPETLPAHRTTSDPQTTAVHRRNSESQAHHVVPGFSSPPRAVTFAGGETGNGIRPTSSDPAAKRKKSREYDPSVSAYYDSRASTRREFKRRATTLTEYYAQNPDLLPQLPYTLRRGWRRWKVIGMGIMMGIDACVVPIVLYYALFFGTDIESWIIFAVVATIWGGPTYVEFAARSLKLIKKEKFYRPLGSTSRWCLDSTEWVFVVAITAVTAFLSAGSAPHDPWIRVLSMPGPSLLLVFGGFMFAQTMWAIWGRPAPFRISSIDKGDKVKPAVYSLLEDIVAVDGGAGRPYREALDARYNASPRFRRLMRDLSLFWSIPSLVVGIICTIVVCIHPVSKHVAYGVGWAVPFIFAAIWTVVTVPWAHSALEKEHAEWDAEHGHVKPDPAETTPSEREEESQESKGQV